MAGNAIDPCHHMSPAAAALGAGLGFGLGAGLAAAAGRGGIAAAGAAGKGLPAAAEDAAAAAADDAASIAGSEAAGSGDSAGKLADAVDAVKDYLGEGATAETTEHGSDLILRSADGTKQIRFDLTNPHGLDPHINVETFEPRNLFPGDKRMIQTSNEHIFPKP